MAARVLIVGGGYVGLTTALGLQRRLAPHEAEITLVNPESFAVYQPFLEGEPMPAVTQRVRRHALALQLLLGDALSGVGLRVIPVLWVREARLGIRRLAGGVRLLSDRRLRVAFRRARAVLPESEVAALIRLAEGRLIPLEGKSA